MATMFFCPSIDASCKISLYLAKWFQRRRFFRNIRKKNCLWWPCLLRDRDDMSNRTFHRCFLPSFDSFDQAVSEEKIFRNSPVRNKNCLWWPCLLREWDDMSNLYIRPSIDASYLVSIHLAKRFQRRRFKCEKLTDDGCQVMTKAHMTSLLSEMMQASKCLRVKSANPHI